MTLLEALISTALFAFVIGGTYSLYTTMQGTLERGELKTDLQQNTRVAVNQMLQEIRMIGYDPENRIPAIRSNSPPLREIRAAAPNCLSFITYQTDSGGTERTIQVTYDFDTTPVGCSSTPPDSRCRSTVRRRQDPWVSDPTHASYLTFDTGSAQHLAELVNSLTFTYYDRFNGTITPTAGLTTKCPAVPASPPYPDTSFMPALQLDYAQMRYVRRIGITLRGLDWRPSGKTISGCDASTGSDRTRATFCEFYTVTVDAYLRNR